MWTPEERLILDEWVRREERRTKNARGYCPHEPTGKQTDFLALDCLEALYGGAAGGGKSDALLMVALEHVDKPDWSVLILRRTYADLALPGAIMDRAKEWLAGTDANWNEQAKRFDFPSGATIQFGYLETEKDKFRYQGAEFTCVCWDELTQFTETQYKYLLSRVRRKKGSTTPLRVRAASNPGGVGHDWVHQRFIKAPEDRAFVPARLTDNPHLDADEYRTALSQLDSTTRAQLERGEWVRDDHGLVYKYDDARNGVDDVPDGDGLKYVLGVDFGASQSKPTTAFVVWGFSYHQPDRAWLVQSEARAGMIPSTIAERIEKLHDTFDFTGMVTDEGALGKGYAEEFRRRYALPVKPAKKADKLGYRKLMNGDFERGVIRVVRATNTELIEEWQTLPWNEEGDDNEEGFANHLSDAALYSWREAKHWLAKTPDVRPPVNTPERAAWEEKKMKQRLINASKERLGRRGHHVDILSY